jgi:hypothetical protein
VDEELFVNFLILLLNASFHAMKNGVLTASEGLRKDVRRFFSLPLPRVVWEKMKPFQDTSFVTFVESCLSEN